MANILVPEYQAMLEQILQSYGKKKEQADAKAIGEAQRRGFVNQTGTSDIEGMLRSSAVQPLAEAEAGAMTDIYGRAASQGAAERVNKENQLYSTSEREATQKYGTAERMSSQDYNKMLQEYMNQYNSAESEKERAYNTQMAQIQRNWAESDAKKKRKGWWKDALGGLAGTAGGTAAGIGIASAMSDIRLKENLKEIGTIKLYEFDYKDGHDLPKGRRVGVMAQDLEKIIPQAVTEKNGYKMVDYNVFVRGI